MRIDLRIELLTDVSLSASARTVGEARCLDHFPGRTLLGAAARVLYDQAHLRCFDIFQRGTVRFSDAVPLVDGFRTVPTPRSWQRSKYGDATHDLASGEGPPDGEQFKGCADEWRDRDRRPLEIVRHSTLRAAMRRSGRTRDGFLYSMESLPAGLVLHATLSGPDDDVRDVAAALCDENVFIGRSRGAEYGRVSVRQTDDPPADLEPSSSGDVRVLNVLCRSRICFRSADTGMPSFEPDPQRDFGLPDGWSLDLKRSVIRTEAYSPFNGARRRPDLEQQVLQRGSVLTFVARDGASPVSPKSIAENTRDGVGIWRNGGLGEVSVQPDWLGKSTPEIPDRKLNPLAMPGTPSRQPEDELFQWMMRRHADTAARTALANDVQKKAAELARLKLSASQWGEIRRIARGARLRGEADDAFRREVEEHTRTGVSSLKRAWGKPVGKGTAADRLRDVLANVPSDMGASAWAEALAARVVRIAKQGDEEEMR